MSRHLKFSLINLITDGNEKRHAKQSKSYAQASVGFKHHEVHFHYIHCSS